MVGNRQDAAHHRIEAAKCHQAAIRAKDLASRLYWEQAERCWLALANQVEVAVNLLSGRNSVRGRNRPRDSRTDSGTSLWGRRSARPASFIYYYYWLALTQQAGTSSQRAFSAPLRASASVGALFGSKNPNAVHCHYVGWAAIRSSSAT